ncbi:MAG: hypothetical protein K2Q18_11390 [Bdellovibrionales bacterium]|nr:hypothetical protein [Bdellovibrionales bacterium]
MKNILIIGLLILISSCSSVPKKPREMLFPYGLYQHKISLMIKDQLMSFPGINRWTEDRFVVIGLGPMDITMIKYDEDRVNYKKELYINKELIPLDEGRALQLIGLLKEMYSWDKSICKGKQCEKSYYGIPIIFELNDSDQVSKIKVERDRIRVNVEITNYEKIL